MADLLAQESQIKPQSAGGVIGGAQQTARGVMEAVPFVGERMAEKAGLPEPATFGERLTRRAARNLPYALGAGMTGVGALPATIGWVGATGLGQAAEELKLPESYQSLAEIVGGAIPQAARTVVGKTAGFIEPQLEEVYKKGKKIFELGPGAKSAKGMKYGAGETEESAIRNLNKFTKEATQRAGNASTKIDGDWLKETSKTLGSKAEQLFGNKKFSPDATFVTEINSLVRSAEGAFGEQGNVVKSILEKNIRGARPRGGFISPSFDAKDLHSAIKEVNKRLDGATGPQAGLLHDLKDSLERLAEVNFNKISPKLANEYNDWKKQYSSFATIRDISQRAGKEGITAAGQINPQAASNVIYSRTYGQPTRNPLYENLGEFGKVMGYKKPPATSAIPALYQTVTESPLAKALQLVFQPRVMSKAAERGRMSQTLAPAQKFTQIEPSESEE